MAVAARWIRLSPRCSTALRTACSAFAQAQASGASPAVLWARDDDGACDFSLIAPHKFAPGRTRRWRAWGLAPLVATFRHYGRRAYLEGDSISLAGQVIASSDAESIGECAVVSARFAADDDGFMDALRTRVASQHGWQFDHSWPSAAESAAIADALAGEPVAG
jgi:hypothetical protein